MESLSHAIVLVWGISWRTMTAVRAVVLRWFYNTCQRPSSSSHGPQRRSTPNSQPPWCFTAQLQSQMFETWRNNPLWWWNCWNGALCVFGTCPRSHGREPLWNTARVSLGEFLLRAHFKVQCFTSLEVGEDGGGGEKWNALTGPNAHRLACQRYTHDVVLETRAGLLRAGMRIMAESKIHQQFVLIYWGLCVWLKRYTSSIPGLCMSLLVVPLGEIFIAVCRPSFRNH